MPSLSLSGTLPRQHPVVSLSGLSLIPAQQPSYISGTILGHPTLRRQSSHDMDMQQQHQNIPRILNRNPGNVQYYYGWQTPTPTLLSPASSSTNNQQQPIAFPQSISVSGMRPLSITTPLTITTTTTTTASGETSTALSTVAPSSVGVVTSNAAELTTVPSSSGDVSGNRTYCF